MVRKALGPNAQAEVLAACRRRCAICFGLHRDISVKRGQIAHLDRDAANPSLDNLVFLCLEHHDQFDSRTSQSKGLTAEEVRRYQSELAEAINQAAPGRTAERTTLARASQRLTIREKSAAEILGNLKDIALPYQFRERVEELYVGRWTQEFGWRATMANLPSKLSEVHWHCILKEVDSGILVFASTVQDVSTLRTGDLVTVTGRISDVRQIPSVNLEDAVVQADDVSFP
jgi:hypothetical protein